MLSRLAILLFMLSTASSALAESATETKQPPTPPASPLPPAVTVTDAPAPGVQLGDKVRLMGFVDTSLTVPLSGFAPGERGVLLGLDQVELDVEAMPVSGLTMRADVNIFPAEVFSLDGLIEQAYIDYVFGGGETGFFVTAGKRNAPVGAEALDPPDMLQFSHGLLFEFASPSNLTGFFLGWRAEDWTLMAWVSNDWDTFSTPQNAAAGARFEYRVDKVGHVGLSSTFGPFIGEQQLMLDLDTSWAIGPVTLTGEVNIGMLGDKLSKGVMFKSNVTFAERFGVTARVDWLDRDYGAEMHAMSTTGAFLFTIIERYLVGALEVRGDIPLDAGPIAVAGALELVGSF